MSNSNTKINAKITASELILSAVFFLQQKNGVSEKDIVNYISEKRNCDEDDVKDKVKVILEKATKNGIFAKRNGLYTIKKQSLRKISSLKNNKMLKEENCERRKKNLRSFSPETMDCDFADSNESFKNEENTKPKNAFLTADNSLKMKLSISSTSHLDDYEDSTDCNGKNTQAVVGPNMNFADDEDNCMEEYDEEYCDEGDDSEDSDEYGSNRFVDKNQNSNHYCTNDNEDSYYENEYLNNNDEELCTTGEEFDDDQCAPKKKRRKAKAKSSKQSKKKCGKKTGKKKGKKAVKKRRRKRRRKVMCCRCKVIENEKEKEECKHSGPRCGSYCDETICNCKNTKKPKEKPEKKEKPEEPKCEEKCKAECEKNAKNKPSCGKNSKSASKSESPKGSPGKDDKSESRESAMSLTEPDDVPDENEYSQKKYSYKRKRPAEYSSNTKSKVVCKERKTANGRSGKMSDF